MLILLTCMLLGHAADSQDDTTYQMMDGVVVDEERGEMYLMTPEGTIEAVALNNGSVRWTSKSAGKPLLKHGDLLISQKDGSGEGRRTLTLVALNTKKQGRVYTICDPIDLPRWAPNTIDQPLGGSLTVEIRWAPDVIYIVWAANTQWVGNGPPPAQVLAAGGARRATGIVRCDLATGNILGGGTEVPPPLPPVRLPEPDTATDFTRVAANKGHYLHGVSNGIEDISKGFKWTVHDAKTKAVFSRIETGPPVGAFLIYGDAIVYNSTEPSYAIHAMHPATGTLLWSRPLRPTWYTGPTPE